MHREYAAVAVGTPEAIWLCERREELFKDSPHPASHYSRSWQYTNAGAAVGDALLHRCYCMGLHFERDVYLIEYDVIEEWEEQRPDLLPLGWPVWAGGHPFHSRFLRTTLLGRYAGAF